MRQRGSCKQQACQLLGRFARTGVLNTVATSLSRCKAETAVNRELQKPGVVQPFLRYVLYRDIRQYFSDLPESYCVGQRAMGVLGDATSPGTSTVCFEFV